MKKALALTLAAIFIASVLTACGERKNAAAAINANVRVTSSDAMDAAAWLTERLGDALTGTVVIGTSADGYGIDLSALENDGYFIRTLGDEAALFARTASGLDRAVRKYAKMAEAGVIEDVTFREGARIKALTVAGRDISEYTVYCENDTYMLKAAGEFVSRIKQATGVGLSVSAETPAAPYIALRCVHDDALKGSGYRWSVSADGLTIECSDAYKPQSASAAVARFLEKRLGWMGLSYGVEDLAPADLIEIAEGETGGETPTFYWGRAHGGQKLNFDRLDNDRFTFGPDIHACHGLQNNRFAEELSKSAHAWEADQPCYLSEEFYEVSLADISAYIERRVAAGAVIGEDFCFLDMAAGDNSAWCQCKDCRTMFRKEGGTEAGAVVTWANRLSETLDESYHGLMYGIFAYAGTNIPPKNVRPNELISITYCFDGSCSAHPLNGERCKGMYPFNNSDKDHANDKMAAQLAGWCDISPNMVVWYYGLGNALLTMTFVHTVFEDVKLFSDLGVNGVYWESEDCGYDVGWASDWLANELMWNIDMTDEEYDAFYDRVLAALYGEGGALIKDYVAAQDKFYENEDCVTCWAWGFYISPSLPTQWWKLYYDRLFGITEAARLLADDSRQQRWLDNLSVECIYKGSVSNYFAEYNAGNDERVAELSRRYSLIDERMSKYGVDMTKYLAPDIYGTSLSYDRDLAVTMWYGYTTDPPYTASWWPDKPEREMPAYVAEALAAMEAAE